MISRSVCCACASAHPSPAPLDFRQMARLRNSASASPLGDSAFAETDEIEASPAWRPTARQKARSASSSTASSAAFLNSSGPVSTRASDTSPRSSTASSSRTSPSTRLLDRAVRVFRQLAVEQMLSALDNLDRSVPPAALRLALGFERKRANGHHGRESQRAGAGAERQDQSTCRHGASPAEFARPASSERFAEETRTRG